MVEQVVEVPVQVQELVREAQQELVGWEVMELCSQICEKRTRIAELMATLPTKVMAEALVSYEALQGVPSSGDVTPDLSRPDGGDPVLELLSILDRNLAHTKFDRIDFKDARFAAELALAATHGTEEALSPWLEKKNHEEQYEI